MEQLKTNDTVEVKDWDNFEFVEAHLVGIKGKKFYQIRDNLGYFNYFVTRSLKQSLFYGRYPSAIGGNALEIKSLINFGAIGFLI